MTLLVVHLVREQNGPAAFERFLDTYLAHPPGIEHELLLVIKGFESPDDIKSLVAGARDRGADARCLPVPDAGMDLTAYARVVAAVPADRYCFVNSHSRVLVDGWLGYLSAALDASGVGLAGATGSWASQQDYRRYQLGLPSGYSHVFDSREDTRLGFVALMRQRDPGQRNNGRLAFKAAATLDLVSDHRRFDRFPAPHLRTNAFVASREVMLTLGFPRIRGKRDAYRLESGRASFTRRVEELGQRVVVVGRDGSCFEPADWDRSHTLWQGTQQNLLVADNQTEDYANANPEGRRLLAQLAWGSKARPDGALD